MPIPYCTCSACRQASKVRGKSLRRRSSLLINDDLLVDVGPDTATASFEFGVDLAQVGVCLQTHTHEDHFDPEFIMCRHREYKTELSTDLVLAASVETLRAIDHIVARRFDNGSLFEESTQRALRLSLRPLRWFVPQTVGEYGVTAYPSNHGGEDGASVYAIERGGTAILYGTDTAGLSGRVWTSLGQSNLRFSLVVLDHTYGPSCESPPGDHLAAEDVARYAARLQSEGILASCGAVYATHISHEGCPEYAELERYARSHGYAIAYDGLTLELTG
jgi:phosphoribosyl 1,2-cyclic phosphodiesterase